MPKSVSSMSVSALALAAVVLAVSACSKQEPAAAASSSSKVASAAAPSQARPLPVPPPAKYMRDHYAKLEDCVADWGYAGKCIPATPAERALGVAFFGPTYSNALRLESQLASRKEAFERGYVTQLDEAPSDKSSAKSEVKA